MDIQNPDNVITTEVLINGSLQDITDKQKTAFPGEFVKFTRLPVDLVKTIQLISQEKWMIMECSKNNTGSLIIPLLSPICFKVAAEKPDFPIFWQAHYKRYFQFQGKREEINLPKISMQAILAGTQNFAQFGNAFAYGRGIPVDPPPQDPRSQGLDQNNPNILD